jgi:hypothetical protein
LFCEHYFFLELLFFLDEPLVSPFFLRVLFVVAAAMRFATFALLPCFFAEALIFSYWRVRFLLFTPRGGMVFSLARKDPLRGWKKFGRAELSLVERQILGAGCVQHWRNGDHSVSESNLPSVGLCLAWFRSRFFFGSGRASVERTGPTRSRAIAFTSFTARNIFFFFFFAIEKPGFRESCHIMQ